MNGEDWTDYQFQPAPRTLLCQFRRNVEHLLMIQQRGLLSQEASRAFVGYAGDFHPLYNVAGLEWKLTGIAREQLDRMPEAVRQQVMPPCMGLVDAISGRSRWSVSRAFRTVGGTTMRPVSMESVVR